MPSSIDRTKPVIGKAAHHQESKDNFGAAANDIDALMKGTLDGATETLSASGAIGLTQTLTLLTNAGAGNINMTLANGTEGQTKLLVFKTKGSTGNAVITPTNFRHGTTITLDTAGESVEVRFVDGKWTIFGGQGYIVA